MSRNLLDRDRIVMNGITLATEYCLKAIISHINFRMHSEFRFPATHDINKLYRSLPPELLEELSEEARMCAAHYQAFRMRLDANLRELEVMYKVPSLDHRVTERERRLWSEVGDALDDDTYSAFIGSNDYSFTDDDIDGDWLDEALETFGRLESSGGISEYYRYAPAEDEDELPTDFVRYGLLFGRFLYEHLFPVPMDTHVGQRTPFVERRSDAGG